MGMPIFTPDEEHQARVMAAIYGPQGAKAGYTDGVCREDLVSAAKYLVKTYDCNCLILGCTELPLILDEDDHFPVAGKTVCVWIRLRCWLEKLWKWPCLGRGNTDAVFV